MTGLSINVSAETIYGRQKIAKGFLAKKLLRKIFIFAPEIFQVNYEAHRRYKVSGIKVQNLIFRRAILLRAGGLFVVRGIQRQNLAAVGGDAERVVGVRSKCVNEKVL